MKPTIVCFSHLCNDGYITGAEKLLLLQLRELAVAYHCILIVPSEGILAHEAHQLGIPYYVQPCQLYAHLVEPCAHLQAHFERIRPETEWESIVQLLLRLKPDYVLTNTSVHPLPAVAAKSLGIPTLWQLTECMAQTDYSIDAVDFIERHADALIASSQTVLHPFAERAENSPFPCRYVLYPSWNMDVLKPDTWNEHRLLKRQELGIAAHEHLIGYIASSIMPSKGLDHFIHMALMLAPQYPDARFLIIGEPVDPAYMEYCSSIIHNSLYAARFSRISFAVHIEHVYPAMDIVIVPSLIPEGFGLTALEGLVFGKAVVVYGLGGLAEIMSHISNSEYAVEPENVNQLAYTVSRLLQEPEHLRQVQEHNRLNVASVFGIERFRQQLTQLFVRFVIEHTELFQLVRGSGRAVYVRHNGLFRRVMGKRRWKLRRLGILAPIRLVTDEVLQELPKGPPLRTVKYRRGKYGLRRRGLRIKRRRNRRIKRNKRIRSNRRRQANR